VNLFDLVVVGALALAAIGGWRLGFTTRVLSWLGLALGLFVAVRSLPLLFDTFDRLGSTRALLVTFAVIFLGSALGQLGGLAIGSRLAPRQPRVAGADHAMGAMAGAAGVVAMAWLLLPAMAATPGTLAGEARTSTVASLLDAHLPPAPDSLDALRAAVGEENFPRVFDALVPAPELGPPPAASGLSDQTAATVARSVVKVEGEACNRIQDGTGFVVGPDTVVTNAHVVAGERTTQVLRDDGSRRNATVIGFDPGRDIAVLRVERLDRPALALRASEAGQRGGVFGHPGGGPLRIAPFRTVRIIDALGRDIYDDAQVTREVLELNASLRPGDSGSALVDADGVVVGLAFAVAPDNPNVSYALSVAEVRRSLDAVTGAAVSTGGCAA
jgi:S1-C subfamily serine protease